MIKKILKKEIPFAIVAGLVLLTFLIFIILGILEGELYSNLLPSFLFCFSILILIPSLIGKYFKQLRFVRYTIYALYLIGIIYAFYTGYIATTCSQEKCGLIIFIGQLSIIFSNFILFSFLYNLQNQTILKSIKIIISGVIFTTVQVFVLLGILLVFWKILGKY